MGVLEILYGSMICTSEIWSKRVSSLFKSIYYPDSPGEAPMKRRNSRVWGRDENLFQTIKAMSSHEIRTVIGHSTWPTLQGAAENEGLSVNHLCLRSLRRAFRSRPAANGQSFLPGLEPEEVVIDPLQSTYRGGADEPMHEWYPYLEAYSPQFVQKVIEEFAPNAASILDPFAGLGTTPITAATWMGLKAFHCELNPVLQLIVDAKLAAAYG